jgi:hypothetical protein
MSDEQKLPAWYGHLRDGLNMEPPESTPRAKLTIVSAKPKRKRKPTLAAALKQANKQGVKVSAATITADEITLKFSEPNSEERTVTALEQWRAKRRGQG